VLDHKLIGMRYFKDIFIYDLLATFPFITPIFTDSDILIYSFDFFIFFKAMTLSKKIKRVTDAFAVYEEWQYYAQLIQLISFIFILSHV
jgi:hypothetical protein